jgi:hypothetical protein
VGASFGAGFGKGTAVSVPIVIRDEAKAEFNEAVDCYDARRIGLGSAFASEVQAVLAAIAREPLAPCAGIRGYP